MAYTSSTLSLAVLEALVHAELEDLPGDLYAISVTVPDGISQKVLMPTDLPGSWRDIDPSPPALAQIGREWIENGETCVLTMPSAITPVEFNHLINPAHPDFSQFMDFESVSFEFDRRLGISS